LSKKIGLLLRSYAKTTEDVPGVVSRALKSIEHACSLRDKNGERIFSRVAVIVPRDHDCGHTRWEIVRALPISELFQPALIRDVPGHHSCGALNEGIVILDSFNIDYAVIISNKAIKALTVPVVEAIIEAFAKGAKVVGVAVDELQEFVLEGRIQNTFAGWDVRALREVGGFDSLAGVEEVTPTVRLLWTYDKCIATLVPKEVPTLDIRKTNDGKARHEEVMKTKLDRQQEEVEKVGVDFNFIKNGMMAGYPKSV